MGEWGSCHVTSDLCLWEGSTGCGDDEGGEHLRRYNNRLNNSLNVEKTTNGRIYQKVLECVGLTFWITG